ncbi:MAG TPA: dihydrofolate reductase [Nocardioidaceae bacterium]|nr:dihydrofolate reductase [Nocardioidaceae bacterium]
MTAPDKRVVMVAAVADNGVIGLDGDIPWSLPEDLKHFRATTKGNSVVMGRRTYESIGHPLPFRSNIVVTRQADWAADGVLVAHSVADAIAMAADFEGDVMVIGGAQVYEAAMPFADVQVLTEVHLSPEGDTHYPDFDRTEWTETKREPRDGFDFVWLERSSVTDRSG